MIPWIFFWSPDYSMQLTSPLGGPVTQAISADAFFGSIKPLAGDGDVEHAIFNYASYGRQIGMLSEAVALLLSVTDFTATDIPDKEKLREGSKRLAPMAQKKAAASLEQFVETYEGIEKIKNVYSQSRVRTVTRILQAMTEDDLKQVAKAVEIRLAERTRPT